MIDDTDKDQIDADADADEATAFAEDVFAGPPEEEAQTEPSHDLRDTELADFDPAEIEELEFVEDTRVFSILESILFSTDRPVTLSALKQVFKGTTVRPPQLRQSLEALMVEYASGRRGVTLEEINGGYQLRTKLDNLDFLKRVIKTRSFRLSGPALEVLAVVAYQQPCPKSAVDEVRGVESGHLLRALMEKSLVTFEGRSDLPGKPMLYSTTRKFLEIFGLRNLRELPSLAEIDDLMPEGIGADDAPKPRLSDMTESLAQATDSTYSRGEEELLKISAELEGISTSSEFFEAEKERARKAREASRAQDIRERLAVNETVIEKDLRWLEKYEASQSEAPLS
jgi:segregation and condensation protein B